MFNYMLIFYNAFEHSFDLFITLFTILHYDSEAKVAFAFSLLIEISLRMKKLQYKSCAHWKVGKVYNKNE